MPRKKPDIGLIFSALGDSTRRSILERLSQRPMSVSQLAEPLDITLAAVVQHLQVLEQCGLVTTEKTGRVRTCSVDPSGFAEVEKWIKDRKSTWERGLDRLRELLKKDEWF